MRSPHGLKAPLPQHHCRAASPLSHLREPRVIPTARKTIGTDAPLGPKGSPRSTRNHLMRATTSHRNHGILYSHSERSKMFLRPAPFRGPTNMSSSVPSPAVLPSTLAYRAAVPDPPMNLQSRRSPSPRIMMSYGRHASPESVRKSERRRASSPNRNASPSPRKAIFVNSGDLVATTSGGYAASSYIPVYLNIYKLEIGYFINAYHSGVEIADQEYSFAGNVGVYACTPGGGMSGNGMMLKDRVQMGYVYSTPERIHVYMKNLAASKTFAAENYDLLSRNCNHFVEECMNGLAIEKKIPKYINSLARSGQRFRCLLPDRFVGMDPTLTDPSPSTTAAHTTSWRRTFCS